MDLSALRADLGKVVETAVAVDVAVVDFVPDQVALPAVLIAWSEPWLTVSTGCTAEVRAEIMAVAGRLEPGAQWSVLEGLIGDLYVALRAADYAVTDSTAPYPIELAGVTCLAASLVITTEV